MIDYRCAMPSELTSKVFQTVDATDVDAFVALFTEDGRLTFANDAPLVGRAAIATGLTAFYGTIEGLHHHVVNDWVVDGSTIVETAVTYDRLDGRSVTIPVVSIWHATDAGMIDDYRVFFDMDPVYAP
jgi:ketosteroid isomerase-like protein